MNDTHPAFKDYVEVAQILKVKGFDGTCTVAVDEDYEQDFITARAYFMMYKGNMLPFFKSKRKVTNGGYVMKFDTIDDKEVYHEIMPRSIYMHKDEIKEIFMEEEIDESQRMQCYNGDELLGTLLRMEEYPQQTMAIVSYKEKEILIPMVEDLIEEIDHKKQVIKFKLPEGFLEL